MTKIVILFVLPILFVGLSIPLIVGKVPPNNTYGFRTAKTLSTPEIWYPANRAAGWFMVAAGVLATCLNLALWWIFPEWPPDRLAGWMTGGIMISLAMGVAASFVYLGRL